jgi:hypothetical protein
MVKYQIKTIISGTVVLNHSISDSDFFYRFRFRIFDNCFCFYLKLNFGKTLKTIPSIWNLTFSFSPPSRRKARSAPSAGTGRFPTLSHGLAARCEGAAPVRRRQAGGSRRTRRDETSQLRPRPALTHVQGRPGLFGSLCSQAAASRLLSCALVDPRHWRTGGGPAGYRHRYRYHQ